MTNSKTAHAKRQSGDSPHRRSSAPPITAHRLFPALVALWFAALFGLGSFAVQPQLLERIVTALNLPALVPATAPPLGFTARLLVALALTVGGGLLGLLLGLRLRARPAAVARRRSARGGTIHAAADAATPVWDENAPRVRARDAHPDAPPRKPLELSEDLVDAINGRVGSVDADKDDFAAYDALADDSVDHYAEQGCAEEVPAPLSGSTMWDSAVASLEPVSDADAEADAIELPAPVAEPVGPSAPFAAAPGPFAAPAAPAPAQPAALRSPVADVPLESLGLVQLIERLALAIAVRRLAPDTVPPGLMPSGRVSDIAGHAEAPVPPSAMAEPGPAPEVVSPPAAMAAPVAAEEPVPRIVSIRPALLETLRPSSYDGDDEDDGHGDIVVPRFLGGSSRAQVALHPSDQPDPEERYSSLLDIALPAPLQETVRIEEPEALEADDIEPVVIFPGQGPRAAAGFDQRPIQAPFARPAPAQQGGQQAFVPSPATLPDPEEADRALRAALATLQRMTAKG